MSSPDAPFAPDDLVLALRLADVADAVTVGRFGAADLHVERKPDRTPVTDADVACEDAIRAALAAEAPGDAVLGEERGTTAGDGSGDQATPANPATPDSTTGTAGGGTPTGRTWVVDPIDGTKNFSRGVPVWATLIALVVDGRPVVGVVSAPALGRRWWAADGVGAFTRDRVRGVEQAPLAVSGVRELDDAYASTTDLDSWRALGRQDGWLALARACWETRAFGDFWHHCLVAEGLLDMAVEPEASAWDLAALQVVVEQAGGRFTDLGGTARHDGGSGLSSNGHLHDAALDVLRG